MVTLGRLARLIVAFAVPACLALDPDIVAGCRATSNNGMCPASLGQLPQLCFDATELGGKDFCVPTCDEAKAGEGDARTCLASGAALVACDPLNPTCPRGLSCYRTDVANPYGVCTDIPVCDEAKDCPASRPICSADLIRELYPEAAMNFYTDHLPCFQGPCEEEHCDGLCLREKVTDPTYVPDICVPTCDRGHRCPPNFYCETNSGPAYPPICVPGLPGYRCAADEDCLVGSCMWTDAGFGVCSVTCESDSYCGWIGGSRRPAVCAKSEGADKAICVSPAPFSGEACRETADCPEGKHCSWYSAVHNLKPYYFIAGQPTGECRNDCSADETCPRVAGLPFVCVAQGVGGCFVAEFGADCRSLESGAPCIGDLVCHEIKQIEPDSSATEICTVPCAPDPANGDDTGDKACQNHPLAASGFCADDGFCRPPRFHDDPCTRDSQCGVLRCVDNGFGGMCQGHGIGEHCSADNECASSACSNKTWTCVSPRPPSTLPG